MSVNTETASSRLPHLEYMLISDEPTKLVDGDLAVEDAGMDSLSLIQLPVVSTCWEEHRKRMAGRRDALFVHQVQHGERVVKVACGDVGVRTRSGDESLDELPAVHDVGLESHVPAPHHCEQLLGGHRVAGLATCRRQQMEEDLVPLDTEPVDIVHEAKRSAWLAASSTCADEGD